MRSLFVICMGVLISWSFQAHGQNNPWYEIADIEKLEIKIVFDEDSLTLKSYYDFHIEQFVNIVKKNPSLGIVVVHSDTSPFSKYRARRVHDFLVSRLSLAAEKIYISSGLPPAYSTAKGEQVVLHIRKDMRAALKEKPLKEIRRPAVQQTKEQEIKLEKEKSSLSSLVEQNKNYIYIQRTKKKKRRSLDVSLGIRDYSFDNTKNDLFAWSLNAKLKKRITGFLNSTFDLGSAFSDSKFASQREYSLALGLESEFSFLNLNTKVYGRKNWAWVSADSKFVTVNDLGLHQGLEFKLVRRPSYALTMGTWAEFSLSNNITEFRSGNVLSFQAEMTFEWFDLNAFLTLYRLSRKYQVFDAGITGLSLGYRF